MMRNLLLCFLLATNCFLIAQPWEPTYGPCNNTPWDIKEINGKYFLSTDWGNYVSTDYGNSWTTLPLPCTERDGSTLTYFSQIGQRIYLRNFASDDGGNTWNKVSDETTLTKYIQDGNDIYSLSEVFGPYCSQDNGTTWTDIKRDLPTGRRTGIVVINHVVYVAVSDQGIFYTTLQDVQWHKANSGLPASFYINTIGTDGTMLYAATTQAVWRSDPSMLVWQSYNSGLPQYPNASCFIFNQNDVYLGTYYGIYKADKSQLAWSAYSNALSGNIHTIHVSAGAIYAGVDYGGIFKSTDAGGSWTQLTKGIYAGHRVDQLCCSNGKVWEMYAYQHMMNSSANHGDKWDPVKFTYQVWWPSGMMSAIYADGNDIYYGEQNGYIYYSHDGCTTTSVSDSGMKNSNYNYAKKFVAGNNSVYLLYGNTLKRSGNRGGSWSDITGLPGTASDICFHKGFIYAVTASGGSQTVLKSADGNSWTQLFTYQSWGGGIVASANTLYVYEGSGIHQSDDAGSTWTTISSTALPTLEIISAAADESGLYVVPLGHGDHGAEIYYGIYHYQNGGWQALNNGLPSIQVGCIASDGNFLYAGVDYDGVYRMALNTTAVATTRSNEAGELDLRVYPNPTEGVITVSAENEGKLRVFDVEGKCIYSTELKSEPVKIDLGENPAGVYVVELQSGQQKVTRKVILE